MAGFRVSCMCSMMDKAAKSDFFGPQTQPSWHRYREQCKKRVDAQILHRARLSTIGNQETVSTLHSPKPVAQHTALVRQLPSPPCHRSPVMATAMTAMLCASLGQGPSWDEDRLLVDSGANILPSSVFA